MAQTQVGALNPDVTRGQVVTRNQVVAEGPVVAPLRGWSQGYCRGQGRGSSRGRSRANTSPPVPACPGPAGAAADGTLRSPLWFRSTCPTSHTPLSRPPLSPSAAPAQNLFPRVQRMWPPPPPLRRLPGPGPLHLLATSCSAMRFPLHECGQTRCQWSALLCSSYLPAALAQGQCLTGSAGLRASVPRALLVPPGGASLVA